MEEPVILTSGFTYEKSAILSHFKINGAFDPLTREPVRADNLILTRNMKQATEDFLKKCPWAYKHIPDEKLEDFKM